MLYSKKRFLNTILIQYLYRMIIKVFCMIFWYDLINLFAQLFCTVLFEYERNHRAHPIDKTLINFIEKKTFRSSKYFSRDNSTSIVRWKFIGP